MLVAGEAAMNIVLILDLDDLEKKSQIKKNKGESGCTR